MLQKGWDRKWLACSKLKTSKRENDLSCQNVENFIVEVLLEGNPYEV
jgi:hypothetical protein